MTISHRVVLITGGGQGIGKAMARRFLEEGGRVIIADADDEAGRETQAEFQALGDIFFIRTDVAVSEEVIRLMDETVERFGQIDVLINNAAVTRTKPLDELSLDDWRLVLDINLTGPFLCSKYAAQHLRRVGGCIINIASTRAIMSEPHTEAYSASKGGLVALTHAMAASLGPQVRVNCISPGWIEVRDFKKRALRSAPDLTEADHRQHPAGRVGRPDDISSLAAFLASGEAGFITGQNFVVDGGMTRKMIYF